MITVHPANADDFSTLGYGALTETEAPIEEHAGGMYQMTLTHPMDKEGRWHYLQKYNIIKAPAPVREVPSFVVQEETPGQTVTRQIYRVDTPSGKRLHLRQKGSLSAKIITMYKPGTEVVRLGVYGDWARVVVCKGGATGYMWADYLKYVRTETETVPGTGGPGKVIQPKQTREQLFRITRPEKDDEAQLIRVKAVHISYDLSGNAIRGALELDNVPADEAVERILAQANDEHPFSVYCNSKKPVSGDWTGKSVAAALWGDGGVVQQIGGELIRDNFDIYILDDARRDLGAEVRHGKNMLGAVAYEDASGVLTRIIPVGKNKDGSRLMLDGTPYVESPRAAEIPVIRSKEIEYDVQVGSDGISTVAAARAKLRQLAAADFTNGADGTLVGLDVNFVQLENTVEYAQYADLQTIHLYDIVHVISGRSDIRAGVRMTGYVFEASGPDPHYTAVTLGEITELETTIYGYDMAEGSMPGTKLINNSVSGAKLRNASIEYAKIATAAIEQLVANSITAVRAHINDLVAGNITTDQLYADLATLAAAQITAAKIAEANIDWASIVTLQATIATIAKAQITAANIEAANIQWAEIDSLAAKMAEIAQAKIDNAEIDAAKINGLEAEVARLVNASIKSADIGFAQIKDLVAGTAIITQGVGGELYISRLAVTEANMVSLSVGELVVKGSDGHFYALGVDASGNVTTALKQVANDDVADLSINAGEKIIEGTVTAACLNADDIFANNAIIKQLIAANIDVAALFAREATIAQLNAADISGNKYLKLAVEGVEQLGNRLTTAESQIKQKADSIELSVLRTEVEGEIDGISIGGRNLLKGTQNDVWEAYTAGLHYVRPYTELAALGVAAGDVLTYSLNLKVDKPTQLRMIMTKSTGDDRVVDVRGAWFIPGEGRAWVSAEVPAEAGYVRMYIASDGGAAVDGCWKGEKLEKGNKATDWSPAPEDPAKSLVTGTTVTITDEQFNVQTKQAAFSIIDDSSGEAEEKLRIDDDGLTSEEATFGTIHSDSVVLTQAAATFTPANAGELQAILDGLRNRFLLGGVVINAGNVSGGEFSLSGVHGNGEVLITGGTFNSLTLNNCRVMVRVQQAKFSASGTAVSATASIVHVWNCTINAGMGLNLNRYTDAILDGCTGMCTTLAGVNYSSVLRVSGSTVPYGVLGSVNGEVYSPLAFAAAPSAPSVETVTSASLAATSTRTWNGGWISGNVLYQGKTGSDGQLRRGCMWFDLSAIAGKTIVSATLTLKRVDGIGGGGSVSVGIYGTTAASASGTPAVGTKYASVSLANGATKSVDVTAAVQALASGSIKGLMVYDTQTGTFSSKNYTYGYCKLYGSGDGAKPVLSVTYK